MPRKPDELKQYVESLCKEKNFTPDATKIALAAVTGDIDSLSKEQISQVIVPLVDLVVGRHADYSRAMDDANARKTAADAHFAKLEKWRTEEVNPLMVKTKTERDAALAKVAAFEEEFGPLEGAENLGGGKSRTATGDIVKTEDIEKLRNEVKNEAKKEMAMEFLNFEKEKSRLQGVFAEKFGGKLLDVNPLLDLMGKHAADGTPIGLAEAFDELYGPKIAEIDTSAREKELKDAEDRGAKAERTRQAAAGAGTGAVQPESGTFWSHINKTEKEADANKLSESDRAAAFGADLRNRLNENEAQFNAETS